MIEVSPTTSLGALTVPMDKRTMLKFCEICHDKLKQSPEDIIRQMVNVVIEKSGEWK